MKNTMKAMVLSRFGGPDAFELRDVPAQAVGPRQVRVRVHATAINPLDYQIRRGDYVDYVPLPAIIGHDISGVIEEVGSHVTEFGVGDEVYYTPRIFGGAGGVGTLAIQVAKAIGARVITTARAVDHAFVKSLGADEAIDFTSEDYVEAIATMTGGRGVNVVFDTIGGDTLTRSPLVLADAGRVVSLVDIAQPQNLIEAWGRNASYHFVFTRQNRGKLDALTHLVERGLVKPIIGATLPLARMGEAHELLENGGAYALRGKVAIDVVGQTLDVPERFRERMASLKEVAL